MYVGKTQKTEKILHTKMCKSTKNRIMKIGTFWYFLDNGKYQKKYRKNNYHVLFN